MATVKPCQHEKGAEGADHVVYDQPMSYLYFFISGERDDFGVVIYGDQFLFHREKWFRLEGRNNDKFVQILGIRSDTQDDSWD